MFIHFIAYITIYMIYIYGFYLFIYSILPSYPQ